MYKKTTIENGITIISKEINYVKSISIGAWIKCGSCNEKIEQNGIAHFIEHMLFKGTKTRSASNIAFEIDSVGGIFNAYTSKEITSYFIKISYYYLPLAINLLADILMNSLFKKEEINKEKKVIMQEIKMIEDIPEDYIYDIFNKNFWGEKHPLGLSILGSYKTINNINKNCFLEFLENYYISENIIFVAVGNIKHNNLIKLITNSYVKNLTKKIKKESNLLLIKPKKKTQSIIVKNLNQVHTLLGVEIPCNINYTQYTALLLNNILGGSMSSRLFQKIREKKGLVYNIYSGINRFAKNGIFYIYFGAAMSKVEEILKLILEEISILKKTKITEKELKNVKKQIKGTFFLQMENIDNLMKKLAYNEIYYQRNISQEEFLDKINNVNAEEIQCLTNKIFIPGELCLTTIGNFTKKISFDFF